MAEDQNAIRDRVASMIEEQCDADELCGNTK